MDMAKTDIANIMQVDKEKHMKVLLIEDDSADIAYIKEILWGISYLNFDVQSKSSLASVRLYLSSPDTRVDVILLDLNLPDSTGYETFLSVHRMAKDIPVLILTGIEDETFAVRAIQNGAQDYIIKAGLKGRELVRAMQYAMERHRLRIQVKQSEESRFYQIVENNADGIIIIDMGGCICFANPAAEQLFGKKSDNLIGTCLGLPVLSSDKAEIDILQKNGGIITVEMQIVITQWDGEPVFLASLRDITERKRLIETINDLNKGLEKRVIDEVKKCEIQEELLIQKSKMATMGEMINSIAHQWRQPLNSLGLIIQDLKDAYQFKQLDDEYIDDVIVSSMKQINYMSDTINDFKNFFKPAKKKVQQDVIVIINSVLSMLSMQLKHQKIGITYKCRCLLHEISVVNYEMLMNCEHGILNVYVYPNELKQVLLNIILNSKDAILSAKANGLIKENEYGQVELCIQRNTDNIQIKVSDNGGGIPWDIFSKLFDPYFTTKGNEGTGIGLYMSKIIIETNMGGRLFAENIGKGAVFTIELPITGAEKVAQADEYGR
ncbi:MAG: PAS domain S-box protein [Nitrospirae bacterium]|nr:PAS domain S-box protein [Nitrospirota bacterium]